jgi:hypothetical protein
VVSLDLRSKPVIVLIRNIVSKYAVFRILIRIRRILMFPGHPDPHRDPLVISTDLDPSLSHKSVERTEIMVVKLNFTIFLQFL